MSTGVRSYEILRMAIDAIGDKLVARGTGYDRSTVHRMARHPMDAEDPDATGAANVLDRLEGLVQELGFRPAGRPVVRVLRGWLEDACERALGAGGSEPLTAERLSRQTSGILREVADVIDACGGEEIDARRLVQQIGEAQEALDRLARAALAGVEAAPESPRAGSFTRAQRGFDSPSPP